MLFYSVFWESLDERLAFEQKREDSGGGGASHSRGRVVQAEG